MIMSKIVSTCSETCVLDVVQILAKTVGSQHEVEMTHECALRYLRIPGPAAPCTGPRRALVRVSAFGQSISVDEDSTKIIQSDTW